MFKKVFKFFLRVQIATCFLVSGGAQAYFVSSFDNTRLNQWKDNGYEISMAGMVYTNNDRFDSSLFSSSSTSEHFYDVVPTNTLVDDVDLFFYCDSSVTSRFSRVMFRHRSSTANDYTRIWRGISSYKNYHSVYNVNKEYRKMEVISIGTTPLNRELRGIRLTHVSDASKNKTLYCNSRNPFSLSWNTDVIQEVNLELHEIIGIAGRRNSNSGNGLYRLGFVTRLNRTTVENTSYYGSSFDRANLATWAAGTDDDSGDLVELEGMQHLRTKDDNVDNLFVDIFNKDRRDMNISYHCAQSGGYAIPSLRFNAVSTIDGSYRGFPARGSTSVVRDQRFSDFHDYDRVEIKTVDLKAGVNDFAIYGKYRQGMSTQGQDIDHSRFLVELAFYDDHNPSRNKRCTMPNLSGLSSSYKPTLKTQKINLRGKDIIGIAGQKTSSGITKLAFFTIHNDDADRAKFTTRATGFYGRIPSPSQRNNHWLVTSAIPHVAKNVKMGFCGNYGRLNGFRYTIDGKVQASVNIDGSAYTPLLDYGFDNLDIRGLSHIRVVSSRVRKSDGSVIDQITGLWAIKGARQVGSDPIFGGTHTNLCNRSAVGTVLSSTENIITLDRETEALVGMRAFVAKSSGTTSSEKPIVAISFVISRFDGYHKMEDGRNKFITADTVLRDSTIGDTGAFTLEFGNQAPGLSDAVSREMGRDIHDGEYISNSLTPGQLFHHSTDNHVAADVSFEDESQIVISSDESYWQKLQNATSWLASTIYTNTTQLFHQQAQATIGTLDNYASSSAGRFLLEKLDEGFKKPAEVLKPELEKRGRVVRGLADIGTGLNTLYLKPRLLGFIGTKFPVRSDSFSWFGGTDMALTSHYNVRIVTGMPHYENGDRTKPPIVSVKFELVDLIRLDIKLKKFQWTSSSGRKHWASLAIKLDRGIGFNYSYELDDGGAQKELENRSLAYVYVKVNPQLEWVLNSRANELRAVCDNNPTVASFLSYMDTNSAYMQGLVDALKASDSTSDLNITQQILNAQTHPGCVNKDPVSRDTRAIFKVVEDSYIAGSKQSFRVGGGFTVSAERGWAPDNESYTQAVATSGLAFVVPRIVGTFLGASSNTSFATAQGLSLLSESLVQGALTGTEDVWRVSILAPDFTIAQLRLSIMDRIFQWFGSTPTGTEDHAQLIFKMGLNLSGAQGVLVGGKRENLVSGLLVD